jgi:hypothetical protein
MKLTQEHLDFEKHSRLLLGLTVLNVEYVEVAYDSTNPKPCYRTQFEEIDTVDFSIFLHCDNDTVVEICWDEQFYQYGIGIRINEPSKFPGNITWDVTGNDLWRRFIGTTIIDIDVTWETVTETERTTRKTRCFTYPQEMQLAFSNDKSIFISAAAFISQGDKEVYGMMDNLMVTDNEELARQVKMIV